MKKRYCFIIFFLIGCGGEFSHSPEDWEERTIIDEIRELLLAPQLDAPPEKDSKETEE